MFVLYEMDLISTDVEYEIPFLQKTFKFSDFTSRKLTNILDFIILCTLID